MRRAYHADSALSAEALLTALAVSLTSVGAAEPLIRDDDQGHTCDRSASPQLHGRMTLRMRRAVHGHEKAA